MASTDATTPLAGAVDKMTIQIYINEDTGRDTADTKGTESDPYESLQYAFCQQPTATDFLVRKKGEDEYQPAAKSALKKAKGFADIQRRKAEKEAEIKAKEQKLEEERQRVLEDAKKVVLTQDPSLPVALKIRLDEPVKLRSASGEGEAGTRVKVVGRVHRERKQKDVLFVTLRDGYGLLQCVLAGPLAKTFDALTLTRETSMEIYGEMWEVPAGAHAPGDRELRADYYHIDPLWKAPGGEDAITNKVQADARSQKQLLDARHLTLRGESASSVMIVRDAVESAFNQAYRELRVRKVSPPALVQTQVEGGSTLFKFDYYGEEAYLTQSSQLYLETCLPSLGNVYCIEKSFRAEKSLTRRHLSEYTHVEAELDYITFDDMLTHIEHMICRVLELVMEDPPIAKLVRDLNPEFVMPQRPFMRMKYTDAIDWLVEHDIPTDEGEPHKFGDDIAEAAERRMTDIINRPILLTHFPVEIKAFYMQKDPADRRVTESVDCLLPGVGEVIGGSMRMYDYDELLEAYKREGISPEAYYWYTDQRR